MRVDGPDHTAFVSPDPERLAAGYAPSNGGDASSSTIPTAIEWSCAPIRDAVVCGTSPWSSTENPTRDRPWSPRAPSINYGHL